jgi:Ca-activated chloride channel family protein
VIAQAGPAVKSAAEARFHLFGDYYLADPWFLALVPLALGCLVYGRSRRGRAAGRVSALPGGPHDIGRLPRSLRQRLAWIAGALQALALVAVIAALARPVRGNVLRTTTSEGVDIVLAVDRSSSMKYTDLEAERTRLEVVKEVVGDFAVRRMTDRVGAADSVALVTFAQYPQLLCPFTLDVGALQGFLAGVQLVQHEVEDGTAIGRGLAKAVALLGETDARSKVAVLLTDGENNVEDILPLDAARAAVEQGVRVYTVLAGRYVFQEDVFGRIYATERELDASELEQIAALTGGKFFRARDRAALEAVYAEIETLERTERREERYTETFDLYPPLLLAATLLYLAAWTSSATWARRLA